MANRLIPIANNCRLPTNYTNMVNWVHNAWTKHKVGSGGLSSIQLVFVNGLISTNSEQNAYYDFTLKAALFYKGVFYPLTFAGASSISVSAAWGKAVTDELAITMQPGDEFYVTNRRVAADGGVAGSYNVIANTGGISARQDGIINGTDNTKDFTQGVGLAYGAKCLPTPVINDATGAISSIAIDPNNLGVNYTAGQTLTEWDGFAGGSKPGSQNPGTGLTGYGNVSGGQITSVSVSAGGTKHRSVNPPKMFVAGSGVATNGFGTGTQSYGPSCILGRPLYKAPGVMIMGDSEASYGSSDLTGNLYGDVQCFEPCLSARGIGYFNIAVNGESAAGWNSNNTQQLAYINYLRNTLNAVIDNVIIVLGTNDFNSNNNSNVISTTQAQIATIVTLARSWGAKAFVITLPPFTTSSDAFVTLANQTIGLVAGASTNYASGGRVEQYNQSVMNGTVASDGVIDYGALYRASGANSGKWRVDLYNGDVASTDDGIHPNNSCGLPYAVQNLKFPAFYMR